MKKILLLNAPPRAGKDTMAKWFEDAGWFHGKFAKVLKERTHLLYGIFGVPYDHFEAVKDEPREEFFGLTPRQAYINTSEKLMKPVHGDDIWVKMFIRELETTAHDYVVISDLGFQVEWETMIQHFGYDKLALVMMYRNGCSYKNDSRSYVNPRGPWLYLDTPGPGFSEYIMNNCFDVENSGTLEDLYTKCAEIENNVRNNVVQPITGRGVAIGRVGNKKVS